MRGLALCAGIGALDLGVARAWEKRGVHYRAVCHVERDAYAAAVLVARMGDASLAPAPIWDDLTTFNPRPWRGAVDCVVSGIPCQPYSSAGRRKGHADERALWPELVRIVRECEPALVFVENVARFLSHSQPLYDALGDLGFEFAPPLLSTAAEYGAPHLRERVFLLAAHPERRRHDGREEAPERRAQRGAAAQRGDLGAPDPERRPLRDEPGRRSGAGGRGAGVARRDRADAADAANERDDGNRTAGRRGARSANDDRGAPDPDRAGREGEWCGWLFDRERQTLRHDADGRACGCRIGGSPWAGESPVCRVDDGAPARLERLRTLGNAVVPAQAEAAFTELLGRLGW